MIYEIFGDKNFEMRNQRDMIDLEEYSTITGTGQLFYYNSNNVHLKK